MPNLGRAPGEGGDNASGLVTEVVLPQLGLGNTGQALAGPIHDYLGVDAAGGLFAGVELANTGGGGGQTGLDNALSNVPGGTLPGDVILPALLGLGPDQRPGEVLPPAIHEYLGIDGLGGGGENLVAGLALAPDAPELFVSAPMSLGGSATATPEPMTMSLLGLGALALLKRRK